MQRYHFFSYKTLNTKKKIFLLVISGLKCKNNHPHRGNWASNTWIIGVISHIFGSDHWKMGKKTIRQNGD